VTNEAKRNEDTVEPLVRPDEIEPVVLPSGYRLMTAHEFVAEFQRLLDGLRTIGELHEQNDHLRREAAAALDYLTGESVSDDQDEFERDATINGLREALGLRRQNNVLTVSGGRKGPNE